MFNLGFGELAIIFIVLILAVGPERLPTLMKGVGKALRTVRQASREIRTTVGIDELLRDDVLQPKPARRPVPKAAIPRNAESTAQAPAGAPPAAAADSDAATGTPGPTVASDAPTSSFAAPAASQPSPASAPTTGTGTVQAPDHDAAAEPPKDA